MSNKINWKNVWTNVGVGLGTVLTLGFIDYIGFKIRKRKALNNKKRRYDEARGEVLRAYVMLSQVCDAGMNDDKYDDDIKRCFKKIKALGTEMTDMANTPFEEMGDDFLNRFEALKDELFDEMSWLRIELRERYNEYI